MVLFDNEQPESVPCVSLQEYSFGDDDLAIVTLRQFILKNVTTLM